MTLYGTISNGQGLTASIRAMHLEFSMLGVHSENITGFDKVGYQRQEPVVSSFAEILGVDALSVSRDNTPGRLVGTQKPLDVALSDKGYFQIQTPEGVKLTRDGRFKIDKDGYLLSQLNEHVLSNNGVPIQLPRVPVDLDEIKIDKKGAIYLFDKKNLTQEYVTNLGVVSDDNTVLVNPNVHQGFNEYSNVRIDSEFMRMAPTRRNFEANRRMFIIQSSALSRIIQNLASA